jgi:hypothetical protein
MDEKKQTSIVEEHHKMLYDVKIPGQLGRGLIYQIRTQGCYLEGVLQELKDSETKIRVSQLLALMESQGKLEKLATELSECPDIREKKRTSNET